MNYKKVFSVIGMMLMSLSALLLLPIIVAIIYRETTLWQFVIVAASSFVVGGLMTVFFRTKNQTIYAKEGFAITALSWLVLSAVGALPFYITGEIPSYIDALFETVSGFTTTGASIVTEVMAMSRSCLFWRSFTHWVGGMGVLVFVMAIIPNLSDRSIHLMRAEMPGPIVGKLVPKAKDTAKILYIIYIVITAVEVVFLLAGGMPLFDSLVHSFGTAGTGGFGIKADSIGGYSPYIQWVITIFMFLFGINFNLYYLILIKKFKSVFKSSELWCYVAIVAASTAAITANIFKMCNGFGEAFRLASFQVSSIITTTGYVTTDFNLWPTLSKAILLILMFIGGCAGSTAGGLKVSRVMILGKAIGKEIRQMLRPRSVNTVKFEGKQIEDSTLRNCTTYFSLYMLCFVVLFLLLCAIETYDFETNFTAVSACFNNVGPGFGAVGPTSNFDGYSDVSTLALTFAMLLGRLEIFPLIITLSPSTWTKK
ncbi:MAG: TrkH family potassium uptake protein [Clostridia bacterium]|nr:TrkH family potassium uptake protein [Clostridia bacterium]MBR6649776.1 TrkH family potassium uptake protein [Clostridia bacterium]